MWNYVHIFILFVSGVKTGVDDTELVPEFLFLVFWLKQLPNEWMPRNGWG